MRLENFLPTAVALETTGVLERLHPGLQVVSSTLVAAEAVLHAAAIQW